MRPAYPILSSEDAGRDRIELCRLKFAQLKGARKRQLMVAMACVESIISGGKELQKSAQGAKLMDAIPLFIAKKQAFVIGIINVSGNMEY